MRFSYSAVWDDTVRLLRGNMSLLLAIAGVFLFLPSVILGYLLPQPTGSGEAAAAQMIAYYRENSAWLMLGAVIGFVGNLAMLVILLDRNRPTVGAAIGAALGLLLTYFLVSLLSGLVVLFGLFLLILPGLYLAARFSAAGPVVVAERGLGVMAALRRSFELTKGNGWAILGMILLVLIAFLVINVAVTVVFGSVFLLLDAAAGEPGVGRLLLLILSSAVETVFAVVLVVLLAAIYRRLADGSLSTGV